MHWRRFPHLAIGLILIFALTVLFRACLMRPATDYPGNHFNRDQNATWIDITWAKDRHSSEEIAALANDLYHLQIHHIFLYVSYLKPTGEFNPTYSYAADFVKIIKAAQPDIDVQAWIGLPLKGSGHGYVDLSNLDTRVQIAEFSAKIMREAQFDGIHLDPEQIRNGDKNVLNLLEEVRAQ